MVTRKGDQRGIWGRERSERRICTWTSVGKCVLWWRTWTDRRVAGVEHESEDVIAIACEASPSEDLSFFPRVFRPADVSPNIPVYMLISSPADPETSSFTLIKFRHRRSKKSIRGPMTQADKKRTEEAVNDFSANNNSQQSMTMMSESRRDESLLRLK